MRVDPEIRFPKSSSHTGRCEVKSINTVVLSCSPTFHSVRSRLAAPLSPGSVAVQGGGAHCCFRQVRDSFRHSLFARQRYFTRGLWVDCHAHPPYSPDFAPSDYHLFPKLKEHLSGQCFQSDDEVREEVKRSLNELAAKFYDIGILKLEHRLQKCIEKYGAYVGI